MLLKYFQAHPSESGGIVAELSFIDDGNSDDASMDVIKIVRQWAQDRISASDDMPSALVGI